MKMASLISVRLQVLLLVISSMLDSQFAQQQRRTAHNSVYGEPLGKGVLYGLFYERLLTDRIGMGIRFSSGRWDLGLGNVESVTMIPMYLAGIRSETRTGFVIDGGVDIASVSDSARIFDGGSTEGTGTIVRAWLRLFS